MSLEFLPSTTTVLKKSLKIQAATTAVLTAVLIGPNPRKPTTTAVVKLSLGVSHRPLITHLCELLGREEHYQNHSLNISIWRLQGFAEGY